MAPVQEEPPRSKKARRHKGADHNAGDSPFGQPLAVVRAGKLGHLGVVGVLGLPVRGIEAHGIPRKLVRLDVLDVGAGVEGLVVFGVKVRDVDDLEGGDIAGSDVLGRVGDGEAGVAGFECGKGGGRDEGFEVG